MVYFGSCVYHISSFCYGSYFDIKNILLSQKLSLFYITHPCPYGDYIDMKFIFNLFEISHIKTCCRWGSFGYNWSNHQGIQIHKPNASGYSSTLATANCNAPNYPARRPYGKPWQNILSLAASTATIWCDILPASINELRCPTWADSLTR